MDRDEHSKILARMGFTERDWVRIKAMARSTTPNFTPAALDDLDAPWRVGAVMAGDRRWSSGRQIGTFHGRALLAWRKDGRS